jgi:flagellar hook-associated protein 1 FlgK
MAIGSFFGLNQAVSGLITSQKNLGIISHNLSNSSTEGYSRQQSVQEAGKAMVSYDSSGILGTGSEIKTVERVRDDYLDFKYWSEASSLGEWEAKGVSLSDVEAIFNEPSDSGFNTTMNDFFEGLQELAKDPSSDAVRAVVREKSVTLTKYFNTTAGHLEKIQEDLNHNVRAKVEEVNSLAKQISEINRQIYNEELTGHVANDLRDKRTVLIDELSSVVNIEVKETVRKTNIGDGTKEELYISISGKPIVDNFEYTELKLVIREEKLNPEDVSGLYDIEWADGNSLEIKSGELRGYIDARDGNETDNDSPNYKGIPFYQKKLNQFVRVFAMSINEGYVDLNNDGVIQTNEDGVGHADGYSRDAVEGESPSGIRFFTYTDEEGVKLNSEEFLNGADEVTDDNTTVINESIKAIYDRYSFMTAKNFSVSQDLFDSYDNFATSDTAEEVGNINVLNNILEIRHSKELFAEGASDDFMKSLIGTLGIDTQQANRISENQNNIVEQIINRRLSVSGVSIDEEMANLVKYQHAYNASAKMINTMNEIYDTLINRTGV